MGERGDIIRTFQRAMGREEREYAVFNHHDQEARIVGRIAAKGSVDELNDRHYLIVDGLDGRAHYLIAGQDVELDDLPIGGIVSARGRADPDPPTVVSLRLPQLMASIALNVIWNWLAHTDCGTRILKRSSRPTYAAWKLCVVPGLSKG